MRISSRVLAALVSMFVGVSMGLGASPASAMSLYERDVHSVTETAAKLYYNAKVGNRERALNFANRRTVNNLLASSAIKRVRLRTLNCSAYQGAVTCTVRTPYSKDGQALVITRWAYNNVAERWMAYEVAFES